MLGVGCGEFEDEGNDSAGVTTDPSGGGVAEAAEFGLEAESGFETESGFDTGASGMTSGGGESGSETSGSAELCDAAVPIDPNTYAEPGGCTASLGGLSGAWGYLVCTEPEPGFDCIWACADGACDGLTCPVVEVGEGFTECGPFFEAELGMCCMLFATGWIEGGEEVEGRPFRPDAGACRFASSHERERLHDCELEDLTDEQRVELAEYWRRVALAEHASIASFARFVAQLVRFAAPPELLRDAMQAAADEVRHAELAFALASRYAGRRIEAGPLRTDDGLAHLDSLAAVVRETVREGCIAETLSAHEAALLAEHARDREVRRVLAIVAADEARHAGLAWRFVAWALERAPELRGEVASSMRSAHEQGSSMLPRVEPSLTLAHGRADAATRRAWQRHALARVVQPCAAALACA